MKMLDCRETWYDQEKKVSLVFVDVTSAAQALARAHLSGPTAAHYLTKALAAVALLGSEISSDDETVILQMKCNGLLGGFNVECTAQGTLRGYTEKKIIDEFDGLASLKHEKIIGEKQLQVTRSVPGRILSQGISNSLDGYFAGSLQRKARIFLEAVVNNEVEVKEARGVLIEALPDSNWSLFEGTAKWDEPTVSLLARSQRAILNDLGLKNAVLKSRQPLSFACRCSPERASAMLNALSEEEKASLPEKIDITCHMCGKIFTLKIK